MEGAKVLNKINELSEMLENGLAERLVSFYLFGSIMISEDFHPGVSDINTFVILSNLSTIDDIVKTKEIYKKFKTLPLSIPLMLKENEILNATDVFPIEFIEIREKNRLLRGKDVLLNIEISYENIRRQCEMEIRAKIIGLRKMLFGEDELVKHQEILYKSLASTVVLLKQLLRLKDVTIPETRTDIINMLENVFKKKLSGIKNLYQLRIKNEKLNKTALDKLLKSYLEELEFFSEIINDEKN